MGGVWIGYLYAVVVCGGVLALIGFCTLVLYAIARVRRPERAARVVSLSAREEP